MNAVDLRSHPSQLTVEQLAATIRDVPVGGPIDVVACTGRDMALLSLRVRPCSTHSRIEYLSRTALPGNFQKSVSLEVLADGTISVMSEIELLRSFVSNTAPPCRPPSIPGETALHGRGHADGFGPRNADLDILALCPSPSYFFKLVEHEENAPLHPYGDLLLPLMAYFQPMLQKSCSLVREELLRYARLPRPPQCCRVPDIGVDLQGWPLHRSDNGFPLNNGDAGPKLPLIHRQLRARTRMVFVRRLPASISAPTSRPQQPLQRKGRRPFHWVGH
ncbi:hypothetical protein LshimejAT787_0201210 [Lyophyllum shimeji]|uniref:Uncharacterized protein n=1 Tax=Lyophyllum shimeji TaxID=47721 RepID=A0A9P3UKP1_LYOSH|nr:hypothetical protein LshimejAT787_0201210 [Lyophyllum shimeji]